VVPETLSQKYQSQKRAGGVAQVVERLPSRCKALNSNRSTAKNTKQKNFNVDFLGNLKENHAPAISPFIHRVPGQVT
jgi:hypothetical protein